MPTTITDLPRELLQEIFQYALEPRFVTKATAATILSDDNPKRQGVLTTVIPEAVMNGKIRTWDLDCEVEHALYGEKNRHQPAKRPDPAISGKPPVGAPYNDERIGWTKGLKLHLVCKVFHANMIEVDKATTRVPMLNLKEFDELCEMESFPRGMTELAIDIFAAANYADPPVDELVDIGYIPWHWGGSATGKTRIRVTRRRVEMVKRYYRKNGRWDLHEIDGAYFDTLLSIAWLKRFQRIPYDQIKHITLIFRPPLSFYTHEVKAYSQFLLKAAAFFYGDEFDSLWTALAVVPSGLIELDFKKTFADTYNHTNGWEVLDTKRLMNKNATEFVEAALTAAVSASSKWDTIRHRWQAPWGFRVPWLDKNGNDIRPIVTYCHCKLECKPIAECCLKLSVSNPEIDQKIEEAKAHKERRQKADEALCEWMRKRRDRDEDEVEEEDEEEDEDNDILYEYFSSEDSYEYDPDDDSGDNWEEVDSDYSDDDWQVGEAFDLNDRRDSEGEPSEEEGSESREDAEEDSAVHSGDEKDTPAQAQHDAHEEAAEYDADGE